MTTPKNSEPTKKSCWKSTMESNRTEIMSEALRIQNLLNSGTKVCRRALSREFLISTPLYFASKYGYIYICQQLIAMNADVNKGKNEKTPLYIAAKNNGLEICKKLISAGAIIDKDKKYLNPLLIASKKNNFEICKVLINAGASVNASEGLSGKTPLYYACKKGNYNYLYFLQSSGASLKIAEELSGGSLLHLAAENGYTEICKHLIEFGCDVDRTFIADPGESPLINDNESWTPLMIACNYGYLELCQVLVITFKANVNYRTSGYVTPLGIAASHGYKKICELLMFNGAKVNNVAKQSGKTPLFLAVERGHLETCKSLIKNGADVNRSAEDEEIFPLLIAVGKREEEMCEELILAGADVNQATIYGMTALICACQNGDINICILLISNNADVNKKKWSGNYSPLYVSIDNGNASLCHFLIASGADINEGMGFKTPILLAIQLNQPEICQMLIDAGANVNDTSLFKKESCLYVACANGNESICRLLITLGADIDHFTEDNDTPLLISIRQNHVGICRLLLSNGANVNYSKSRNVVSPLFRAVSTGNTEILRLLILCGADVNFVSSEGISVLYNAILYKEYDSMSILLNSNAQIHQSDFELCKDENDPDEDATTILEKEMSCRNTVNKWLIARERVLNGNSPFHKDNLPRDIFKSIGAESGLLEDKRDIWRITKSRKCEGGFKN